MLRNLSINNYIPILLGIYQYLITNFFWREGFPKKKSPKKTYAINYSKKICRQIPVNKFWKPIVNKSLVMKVFAQC